MSNCNVHLLTCEVDMLHGCGHSEIDLRMGTRKLTKPMHEPFGGKVGGCADCQNARGLVLNKTTSAKGKSVERIADHGKILAARLGNDKPLAFSIEELDPKCHLQRLDLLAHGGLCDAQLLGCPCEAFAPSRSLERFDGV